MLGCSNVSRWSSSRFGRIFFTRSGNLRTSEPNRLSLSTSCTMSNPVTHHAPQRDRVVNRRFGSKPVVERIRIFGECGVEDVQADAVQSRAPRPTAPHHRLSDLQPDLLSKTHRCTGRWRDEPSLAGVANRWIPHSRLQLTARLSRGSVVPVRVRFRHQPCNVARQQHARRNRALAPPLRTSRGKSALSPYKRAQLCPP